MGIIRLARGLTRPIRATAQKMTAQHAEVTRRSLLAMAPFCALLRKHNVQPGNLGLWFPEDLDENQLSTYPCDPNGDQLYSDQYRVLNPNPVTVTSSPIQLALENRKRKEMFIVNVSTQAMLIAFGFIPTTSVYTLPLQACGTANDGTGGIIIDQAWQGQVWAILQAGASGNGSLLFTELPA